MTDRDIVLLTTAGSEVEAGIMASELRANGIRVMVQAGGPGIGAWASSASFEHRLYVDDSDLELAREVIVDVGVGAENTRPRRDAPRVNPRRHPRTVE